MGLNFWDHLGRSWNRVAGDAGTGGMAGGLAGGIAGGAIGATGGTVVAPGLGTAAGLVGGASLGGQAGGILGGALGGLAGVGDALWNWHGDDVAADQAAQQNQGLAANPAVQQAQQRMETQYNDVASRTNPFAGDAWRPAYLQQSQGLAGNYANQEARGLAQAGATGGQQGATTTAAIRAAHGNALSALQANAQMHYQDMGNQWQQGHDSTLGGLASGMYANAVGQDNQAYQRGQDVLHRQDASNAAYGQGLGGIVNAGLTFAGTENGGKAFGALGDYAHGLMNPASPLTDASQPTSSGGLATRIMPQKDRVSFATPLPKRGPNGGAY